MEWLFILIPIVALILLMIASYVKAPPDTAFIISGYRKPRILIGKAGFRIPFLERLDKLSLKMFSVDVKTADFVPNAEYINIKVDATVKIRIGQSDEMMILASKFFLNENEQKIISRVQDTLEGNMREIVGQMRLEEMVTDRKAFSERVQENAIPDLEKMGLEMISFNVQSFADRTPSLRIWVSTISPRSRRVPLLPRPRPIVILPSPRLRPPRKPTMPRSRPIWRSLKSRTPLPSARPS